MGSMGPAVSISLDMENLFSSTDYIVTDRYHFIETDIFKKRHRYFIDHRYRYSKICLPMY